MNYAGKFDAKLPADASGLHSDAHGHVETIIQHATHAPSGAIIVPDAQLLFNGEFNRSGVDLILSRDGHELVLQDYFKGEKRAALSSPDGAHLTGDLVSALTGHTEYAQADGSASAGKVIGHVTKLVGTATAIRNGVSIILNNGDNVEKGDVVQSGSDSTLGITFIDGTVFGLSSNARMVLNEMVYDPNGSNNSSLLSLVAGTISFVAGETAKHGDMKIDTPVATMGIRGTAVLAEIHFIIPNQPGLPGIIIPNQLGLPDNLSQLGQPEAHFQVLVEPDGTTGSYILFDKNTLTPIATVNQAGQQINISQGQVSITNAPLPPDVQKLIQDVFTLKFTDNSNPKTFDHQFTDTILPQSLLPIMLANGATAIPVILNVNTAPDNSLPPNPNGLANPLQHIPGPPSAVAFGGSLTELVGKTGDATDLDTVSGKVNYADINAGDVPTVQASFNSFTYQNAQHNDITATLNAQQLANIKALEVKLVVAQDPAAKNTGSATWTYSIADNAADFLGNGEKLTLTYVAQIDNNYAPNNEAAFASFTITITGTNDAPTITATSAALAEHSGILDHAGGTITFADVDLTDRPVVSTTFSSFTYRDSHGNDISSTLTAAQQAAVEASLNLSPSLSNANNGSVVWSYDIADSNLGFLADGSVLSLNYLASVDDGHGGVTTAPIAVTILGVSDVPHLVAERAGHTGDTAVADSDTASGALTFTGVDLSSVLSIVPNLVSATWSGGSVLPGGLASTLESSFTTSLASSVGFTFSATDNNFDFLADGETLAIVYDITVTDTHGVSLTRPVTIIITGTNDAPTITSNVATEVGSATEWTDLSAAEIANTAHHASGSVTFADVDLSDHPTSSIVTAATVVTSSLANGYTLTAAEQAALVNAFTIDAATFSSTAGTGGIGWHYDIADSELDFLGANDTVTLAYTVQVNDGNGGTASQVVTITVHGTEDAPTITSNVATEVGSATEWTDLSAAEIANTAHHASGSVTFADVDLSDHPTSSIVTAATVVTSSLANGYTLTAAEQAALVNAFTIDAATFSSTAGTGGIGWHYDIADSELDFLGANDTVTLAYTVQVNDGNGGTASQVVTITVHGTEDAPTITSNVATEVGSATEWTDLSAAEIANTAHHASGSVTFADVDLSDHPTSSIVTAATVVTSSLANGYTLTAAEQAALVNAFTIDAATFSSTAGTGGIGWHYDIADSELDFLGANDTVTLAYTVQVNDGNGGTASQVVTITVHGTEDAPTITSNVATEVGSATEWTDLSAAEIANTAHHASGSVTFADVDLSDHPTSSIVTAATVVTSSLANGYTLTAAEQAALVNAFTIDAATFSSTAGTGGIGWHYDIADSELDFLGANDTVTLAYTVQVNDGNGGTASQVVTITVHGTEDAPTITSNVATEVGSATEWTDLSAAEIANTAHHASGSVTFADVDLSDHPTSSIVTAATVVTSSLANGYTLTAAEQAALVNAFTIDAATFSSTAGTGGIGWHYDIADSELDFLGANDTVTLAYTVQVNDGNGGTASQVVTITVHGTEDAPTITSNVATEVGSATEWTDLSAAEIANTAHHASGSVTFADVDLSDHPTSSIVTAATVVTSSLANGYTLTAAEQAALVNAFTIDAATFSSTAGTGGIGWHYDIADSELDFLGANDTVTLAYTVQVNDGNGGTASQVVTITVHGTEDAPTITSNVATEVGSATEWTDLSAAEIANTAHHASGSVTFADVDLSDHPTSSIVTAATVVTSSLANGYTLTAAEQAALVNAFTIDAATFSSTAGTGGIGWHYDIADSELDFLGANDTVTLAYTVQVNDGNGGTASQVVTITVHGTEDAPTITSNVATEVGSATEWTDLSAAEIANTAHHASGSVTFADVDLSDHPTSSIVTAATVVTSSLANGYTLTAAEQAALVNAFTIDAATFSSTAGTGGIGWHYDIADSELDFLGANDTVTLAYTVQVNDGNGGTASQVVTITVHGTEDAPTITSNVATEVGSATEWTDLSAAEIANTAHHASGSVTFADVDLSDHPTSSIVTAATVVTSSLANGYTLTAAEQAALVNAFTIDAATFSSTAGTGGIGWHYDIADSELDFLGANDTVTLAYTVQVNDGNGGTASQVVTITVHGTEDAPTITSNVATEVGSATEWTDLSAAEIANTAHHASGSVTFADVDLSDHPTSSIVTAATVVTSSLANGYTLTAAEQAALVNAFTIDAATFSSTAGTGGIGWHYDIADSELDFLGANDTVTLAYTVQVNDGNGGTASQVVTITVHGTEDAPTITSNVATEVGSATEWTDLSAAEIANTAHHASGSVTFADVDLSDHPTSSIVTAATVVTSSLANGYTLTAAEQAALVNAFTIDAATFSSTAGTGGIGWHYDIADSELDFLGANDTVTLAYTVQVNDGNGGTASQVVTITVHGTEDAPTITSNVATEVGSATEWTDLSAAEIANTAHHASGSVTFADVDLSDHPTSSIVTAATVVTSSLANGYTLTAAEQAALVNAFTIDAATFSSTAGTGGIGWHYDIADSELDFLGANDTVTLAYTVQVNDGNGGTASQVVTITVHGTEDAPTITSNVATEVGSATEWTDLSAAEIANTAHHASGSVTFADVDLSDHPTSSIVTAATVVTSSLANGYTLTAAEQAALVNAFTIDAATFSSTAGTGGIGWHYDIADSELDFLGANDTVTLAYTVQVNDGNGGTASQVVTITVHGTEDAPVISLVTTDSASATKTETNAGLTASGTLTITDADLSDTVATTVTGITHTGPTGGLTDTQLQAMLGVSPASGLAANPGDTHNLTWTFNSGTQAFDFLAATETLRLTYTLRVSDGHGGTTTQNVVVTVTGTNDAPTGVTFTVDANAASPDPDNDSDPSGSHIDETSVIGRFAAVDPDTGDTFTYSLGSGSSSNFSLSSSGVLSTGSNDVGSGTYTVNVIATDNHAAAQSTATPTTIWVGTAGNNTISLSSTTNTIIAYGLDGNDTITTGSGNDALIGGHGADTMTGGLGSDTFDFFAGDSVLTIGPSGTISGYDTITDYTPGATASASEKISFSGISVSSATTSSVVSTLTLHTGFAVTSDNVSNGIVTFNDANGTNSVSLTSLADVAAAVQFLQAYDIGTTGSSLAFGATISGVAHTFVFIQGSNNGATNNNDVLIDLPHVSATSLSTSGLSNQLAVIGALAPAGIAGEPINLALTDPSGGQSGPIAVTVAGIPSGWTLTAGTDNGDGSWTVQSDNIAALSITSLDSYSGALVLNVAETWTNADGSAGNAVVADNVEAYTKGSPIFAWSGDDTLTASSGNDLIVFANPIGNDTIRNFDVTADKIDLIGFDGISGFNDVQSHLSSNSNGDAVIAIGYGGSITLQGVSIASLTADDFVFDQTPVTNNAGTMTIGDGAMLPLGGTIDNTGTIALNSTGNETDLQLIEHGIMLTGAGHVVLSDSEANAIRGTSADVTLTNVDNTISGAGQIGAGQLTLINEGTIDATGANSLTVDTGVNVVSNSGTLEATGSGGLAIASAIANSGILWANGATLTALGEVSGNGIAKIDGVGTVDFEASSTANVVFGSGAAGTLKLGDSFHFNGTISGFAGSDIIDLANVGSATASISYHENAAGTGGTLEISDGAQTVGLSLLGNYSADSFSIATDHAKGTLVTFVPHDLIM